MALAVIRRHKRWLYVFLWLVIAAFIVFYVPMFLDNNEGTPGEIVGRVSGQPITFGEFERLYHRQLRAFDQMYQGRLDPAMARRLGLPERVFSSLAEARLIALECRRLGIAVDDATLARTVAREFQVNGRPLAPGEIRRRLDLQGVSVEEFEQQLRASHLRQRLESLVGAGVQVTAADVEREYRRRNEQVRLEYVIAGTDRFRGQITLADAAIRQHFDAHRERYRVPEQRVLSYALVDREDLKKRESVTESEVEAHYRDHTDEYTQPAEVCASHILVKVQTGDQNTQGHPEAEAKRKAEGLLAQLRADADFAALAKSASEDEGSAAAGGDLGCFARGRMVPEFDSAAFELPAGQLSELVRSSYGYHIIRVNSHRTESTTPLDQVRARIRQTLLDQRVEQRLAAKSRTIFAQLRRGKHLADVAQAEGLSVAKSTPFARGDSPAPLSSATLVARAFELKSGQEVPEPFALPGGQAFVALAEIRPSRLPELKEVQETVKRDLVERSALERARALADDLRARATTQDLDKAATALGLVRKETPSLVARGQALGDLGSNTLLEEAVFTLAERTVSSPIRVADGYAILRVLEKKPFDPAAFEKEKPSTERSLLAQKRQEFFEAYLAQLWQRYGVERTEAYRRVLGE